MEFEKSIVSGILQPKSTPLALVSYAFCDVLHEVLQTNLEHT